MRIAISGKLGSGKNTVATIIQEFFTPPATAEGNQRQWKELAFAYRLKEVVAAWTGTTIEQNLSRDGKGLKPPGSPYTLGEWQQKVGMMGREYLGTSIWIDLTLAQVQPDDFVIITDCRFRNEADRLKQEKFFLIRVEGDPAGIRQKNVDKRDLSHPSETDLDDYRNFDIIIHNTGTLDDLKKQVANFLADII